MLFAACAVAVQLDRDYIRAPREAGTPMPKIGRTVTINTGKNAGNHPSVASQYRALAEAATITYVALSDYRPPARPVTPRGVASAAYGLCPYPLHVPFRRWWPGPRWRSVCGCLSGAPPPTWSDRPAQRQGGHGELGRGRGPTHHDLAAERDGWGRASRRGRTWCHTCLAAYAASDEELGDAAA